MEVSQKQVFHVVQETGIVIKNRIPGAGITIKPGTPLKI